MKKVLLCWLDTKDKRKWERERKRRKMEIHMFQCQRLAFLSSEDRFRFSSFSLGKFRFDLCMAEM